MGSQGSNPSRLCAKQIPYCCTVFPPHRLLLKMFCAFESSWECWRFVLCTQGSLLWSLGRPYRVPEIRPHLAACNTCLPSPLSCSLKSTSKSAYSQLFSMGVIWLHLVRVHTSCSGISPFSSITYHQFQLLMLGLPKWNMSLWGKLDT